VRGGVRIMAYGKVLPKLKDVAPRADLMPPKVAQRF
jgi:hypothetical protein